MNVGFIIRSINTLYGLSPNLQHTSEAHRATAIAVSAGVGFAWLEYYQAASDIQSSAD